MIRVFAFIVVVFLVAVGFAWLADRPGEVVLHWQGYEIRTSLLIAGVGLAVIVAALAVIGAAVRAVVNAPRAFESFLGARRRDRGYRALSTGMIAVGAGDGRTARRSADEARNLLGEAPLVLLLSAQAAQLGGDGERARIDFETLAARTDTRILGLHGLFVEARRQGEHEAARHFAAEAATAAPKIAWAGAALFEYQARAGDWLGALQTLSANATAKLVDKAEAQHLRAALLTARAADLEAGEPGEARAAALEAHRLEPGLVPAAVIAGRLLTRAGDIRRASRILEQAWKAEPHPDIADAYGAVRPGDSVRDRLKRVRRLADLRANHPEGAMAVARAAIDAQDFAAARAALDGLARAAASERACLLMAEIEEREHGDQGRVRVWLIRALSAPRDPTWVADGRAFERWAPVSPVSGRVGAFAWRVASEPPVSREALEIGREAMRPAMGPELAMGPGALPPPAPQRAIEASPAIEDLTGIEPVEVVEIAGPGTAMAEPGPAPDAAPEPAVAAEAGPTGAAEPVMAELMRPPDDPGPEPDETVATDGNRRRFRLF